MERRKFLRHVLGVFGASWTGSSFLSHSVPTFPRRWNVLLIFVDDLRNELGCYGNPVVRSPHVDRLAARGVRFDRAYCQFPVCNPSRASLLTGLRPDTTRVWDNKTPFRSTLPDAVTLPQLFRQHGYFTARVAKVFHDGLDDPQSWDIAIETRGTERGLQGMGRSLAHPQAEKTMAWCRWLAAEGGDEDQPDGQTALEAIRLLEEHRKEPFFLALGFRRPHDPFIAPKRYFDLYPMERLEPPRDLPRPTPDPPLAIPGSYRFDHFTDQEKREFLRAYYAGISFMDAQLGKVLEALERWGLFDRTIVVFLGDHGYHLGERGWWNKNTLFELSARAPLIVFVPGMPANGRACQRLVEFVDIYPTLAELCGLPLPENLEGFSFRPLLEDPSRPWKKAAFTQVQRGKFVGRSVRTERWRFTEWDEGRQGVELYDHETDPQETMNLALDPRHAGTVLELQSLLRAGWRAALPS